MDANKTTQFSYSILYDSWRLHLIYSAADNIPWAQFPTPRAQFERYLQDSFLPFFTELVLAKDFRLCQKQLLRIVAGQTLICYSFLLSCTRIQGIRRIEVVVSYLFCQAQLAPTNTIKFYLWYDSLVYKYYNAGRQFHVKRGKLREK